MIKLRVVTLGQASGGLNSAHAYRMGCLFPGLPKHGLPDVVSASGMTEDGRIPADRKKLPALVWDGIGYAWSVTYLDLGVNMLISSNSEERCLHPRSGSAI